MHVDAVPNRTSRPTYLLRESYREGKKVRKRTLANLSALSDEQIEAIRAVLAGTALRPVAHLFEIIASRPHGHVQAVRVAMQRLKFAELVEARGSFERDVVCAMVAARILAPHSKLATSRWWHTTTVAEEFGVAEADEEDLYAAMDWLLERQERIERRLAARHLQEGALALYDVSSSYFEGQCCPLAKIGHNRDGKKNKLQVNYGLLTTRGGCPVAVGVYEGNTADTTTLLPEVTQLREEFGLERVVLVGDRGMISHKAIKQELQHIEGLAWITALKSGQIRSLVESGSLQLGLFDERSLFEFTHADYPNERLIACRNPELARLRAYKREQLLQATEKELEKVRASAEAGRLKGKAAVGVRAGRVVNKYKVAKHFELTIEDHRFAFARRKPQIAAEAALDGLYVIRTNVPEPQMSAPDTVRNYKSLADVERAFRSLKSVDLKIRPIHHRLEKRVRAHIFLCMLAYYVEWHMREAWRELLFADEDLDAKAHRDPVAPAERSDEALRKISQRTLEDGSAVHSFATLLEELATLVRNTCVTRDTRGVSQPFAIVTTSNTVQRRALELLQTIAV